MKRKKKKFLFNKYFLYRELPVKRAFLFVNGMQEPFAEMRYTPDLRQYDNKIIECSFQNRQWHFHRQRTDKSFPNAKGKFIHSYLYFHLMFFFLFVFLETAFGKFLKKTKFILHYFLLIFRSN